MIYYLVKRTDLGSENLTRKYFQEGYEKEFEKWAFSQSQATRFKTREDAMKSAEGWLGGRFKVVKIVPRKVTT